MDLGIGINHILLDIKIIITFRTNDIDSKRQQEYARAQARTKDSNPIQDRHTANRYPRPERSPQPRRAFRVVPVDSI